MSELRQNIATREWVILAPERAWRPDDFAHPDAPDPILVDNGPCPFCPGHEALSPHERCVVPDDNGGWLVRAVANRFPALSRDEGLEYGEEDSRRWMSGVGICDVVVETPEHDTCTACLDAEQLERVLDVYGRLFRSAAEDDRIELVTLFKNHGSGAGTSLAHPHSQLIATPVVPAHIRQRVERAMQYYDDHRACVFCQMLDDELAAGVRLVDETEHFAAFVLYAALSPFHLWLLPKRHQSFFTDVTAAERADLAVILRRVLRRIYKGLSDPDYNFLIRSQPGPPRTTPYFHWYLSVVPRVSTAAGFELGSGMFINTVPPEESAAFLRNVVP